MNEKASGKIIHEIPPVWNKDSKVLLLGTMPSPASRAAGFFYMHPQNRFWKVTAAVFDEKVPESIEEKREFAVVGDKNRLSHFKM